MTDSSDISFELDMAPAVSVDYLHLAVQSAWSVAVPNTSPAAVGSLGRGPYGTLTGESAAPMAAGIAPVFPADWRAESLMLKGPIRRGIFALSDLAADARFEPLSCEGQGDEPNIDQPLLGPLASVPMPFGGDVPLDAIFAMAGETAAGRNGEAS